MTFSSTSGEYGRKLPAARQKFAVAINAIAPKLTHVAREETVMDACSSDSRLVVGGDRCDGYPLAGENRLIPTDTE